MQWFVANSLVFQCISWTFLCHNQLPRCYRNIPFTHRRKHKLNMRRDLPHMPRIVTNTNRVELVCAFHGKIYLCSYLRSKNAPNPFRRHLTPSAKAAWLSEFPMCGADKKLCLSFMKNFAWTLHSTAIDLFTLLRGRSRPRGYTVFVAATYFPPQQLSTTR